MKKYNIDLGPTFDFKKISAQAKEAGFGSLAGLIRFLVLEWSKTRPEPVYPEGE